MPLVGREQELELLRGALARVRRERSPQLVTLVGVPGIGKSRLVFELAQLVESDPDLISWRQGRCLPYGDGVAFWALAEAVKAQAGILESDAPDEAAEKLGAAVADLVPEAEAAWVEAHLRPLVGLEAAAELAGDRRGEAFAAWRRFFEALADRRPLVLVFEDLQWADDDLLDFIDYLVEWASEVPLLVVCTGRPELLDRRPGWGGGKPNALTISLSPLSDDETARLIGTLLKRPLLPAEQQAELLSRAGGNPLYAEQFARMLAERGSLEGLPLPETVQGMIAARLDLLEPEQKTLLQEAAVLGKVFWSGALASIARLERRAVEERLHGLERRELVRRARQSSVEGETEYAFRHLLVPDVGYGQIPRAERAEKHRLAAEWIESLGRPEDHAEMLAHHYLAALEYARAARRPDAELAERARFALRQAGDRAFGLNAFAAAARFYERTLDAWPDDAERPPLLLRFAQSLHVAGGEGREQALERARDALLAAGHRERAAEAEALLAELWWYRGQRDRCFEHLGRAHDVVADAPPSAAKARVLSNVARYRALAGEPELALGAGEEALRIAEQLGLDEVQAHALNNIGIARDHLGDDRGAVADLERSIEIALAANSPEAARAYNNLAAILDDAGDLRRSDELFEEAVRTAERLGNANILRYARSLLPGRPYRRGQWDEAASLADEVIAACEHAPHYGEVFARRNRAHIRLARSDDDGALADGVRALEVARAAKDPQVLCPALALAVRIRAELGIREEAEALARELVHLVPALGHRSALVHDLVLVAERLGIAPDVRRALDPLRADHKWTAGMRAFLDGRFTDAADRFADIGDRVAEASARLHAAEQLVAEGRRAEADVQLRKALAFYRSVGATRYIRQAEGLLAATA